jgi:hypothetical protein
MSDTDGIDIRSYRNVFALERRIYRVEGVRLNPSGVPVRGVVYFLALLIALLVLAALPVTGWLLAALPWYVRDLALPAGAATVLAVLRLEGRAFHIAAFALLRHVCCARALRGLMPSHPLSAGPRWSPPDLVLLADGSDARLRRIRFQGPGAALVTVSHVCAEDTAWRARAPRLRVRGLVPSHSLASGRVLALERRARVDVYAA